jgi:hypothetical protein
MIAGCGMKISFLGTRWNSADGTIKLFPAAAS